MLKKLTSPLKDGLIETQINWKKQLDLEINFINSIPDLRFKIGSGGMRIRGIHFMNKIRERTLELEEILNRLVD